MYPILWTMRIPLNGGFIDFESYPVMHFFAFLALLLVTLRLYGRDVGPSSQVLDVMLVALPAGLLGARYLGAWASGKPAPNPFYSPVAFWTGNRWAYGGILAGMFVALVTAKLRGLPIGRFLDATGPGLALGVFLCRLGCFLGGCCYGKATDSIFGVRFPDDHPGMSALRAGDTHGLHPTQLYLAASGLVILFVLVAMRKRGIGRPGDRFAVGATIYGVSVFLVEFLRGDAGRHIPGTLTLSQVISAGILTLVLIHVTRRLVQAVVERRRARFAFA